MKTSHVPSIAARHLTTLWELFQEHPGCAIGMDLIQLRCDAPDILAVWQRYSYLVVICAILKLKLESFPAWLRAMVFSITAHIPMKKLPGSEEMEAVYAARLTRAS
ncbi:MAG TPA: hypothetical protein VN950_19055 [Terriglobales bacterium]|nr:hypothetical protein [Terriglobales bacterium]